MAYGKGFTIHDLKGRGITTLTSDYLPRVGESLDFDSDIIYGSNPWLRLERGTYFVEASTHQVNVQNCTSRPAVYIGVEGKVLSPKEAENHERMLQERQKALNLATWS